METLSFLPASDASLVRRAMDGDPQAFEILVRRYQTRAQAMARALGAQGSDVEDVVQEAFLRAFRALPELRDPSRFGPWLLSIARNAVRHHLKGGKPAFSPDLDQVQGRPAESMEGRELKEHLWHKVAELSEPIREAIFLYYQDGESVKEVARVLGITRAAVKMRLQRGRDILREELWREVGDSLLDMLPSARERKQKARSLSLLLLAAVFPSWAKGTKTACASTVGTLSFLAWGGALVTIKNLCIAAALVLTLSSVALFLAIHPLGRMEKMEPSGEAQSAAGRAVENPPTGEPEPLATTTAEAAPLLAAAWRSDAPLFGVVLLPDGTPAAASQVSAYLMEPGALQRMRWDVEPLKDSTDGEGRFEIWEAEPGRWAVVAEAAQGPRGLVPGVAVPVTQPLKIILEQGAALEGVVTDDRDAAIPGAEVTVRSMRPGREPRIPMVELKTTAEDGGGFRVLGLPAGAYVVSADAPMHWPASARVTIPGEEPLVIPLKRGTYVAGRAFIRDHRHPLSHAEIQICRSEVHGGGCDTAKTGSQGEFLSRPFQSGTHSLTFAHEPFRPVSMEVSLTEAAPRVDLEIVFVDGVTVEGEVRNREGAALPLAILRWSRVGEPFASALECIADPQGRFERKGLESGRYRIMLQGPPIDEARLQVEVLLENASPQWVPIAFDIPPPLIVHVEDVHGTRVAGAPLSWKFKSERVSSFRALRTDARGTAALVGFPAEGHLRLTAGNRRMGTGIASLDMATAPSQLVLRLAPWGSIAGKVLEENERPVPGASVIASKDIASKERGDGGRVETAEDGSFELPVPAGKWDLEVSSGPHGKARRQGVQVEPAERSDLIAIVVSHDPSSIRGRVLDAAGEPIGGVSVWIHAPAFRDSEHSALPLTDLYGWFSARLPEAQYVVKTAGFEHRKIAGVRPGGEPLEIRLEPLPERSLSGRVLLDGEPVEGAQVRYFSLEGAGGFREPVVVSGPAGVFEVAGLEAASAGVVVTAQSPQFAFARSQELLLPREGKMEGIEVLVQPGTDLELHVTQPDGLEAAGVNISLKGEGKPPIRAEGRTDAKGVWRLRRLPPGNYQLRVDSPTRDLSARTTIEWQGDPEQKTVEVQLRANPSPR